MRRVVHLLLVSSFAFGLTACQREPSLPMARSAAAANRAASGSSLPEGAADDGKEALMRTAFPEWDGKRPWVLDAPDEDPKRGDATVAAMPQLVLAPDATHRVLVFGGPPSDDDGNDVGGHPSPGDLGAVWFTRRDGRWMKSGEKDSILWTGFMGDVGKIKAVELGGGHQGVSIENGSCWQGFCADYLQVLEFDASHAQVVVEGLRVATTSTGAEEGCSEALAGHKPGAHETTADLDPDNCFDVGGIWHFVPLAGAERSDLVVDYSGAELAADDDGGAHVPRKVAETLVLRYANGAYKPVRGKNPTHDF